MFPFSKMSSTSKSKVNEGLSVRATLGEKTGGKYQRLRGLPSTTTFNNHNHSGMTHFPAHLKPVIQPSQVPARVPENNPSEPVARIRLPTQKINNSAANRATVPPIANRPQSQNANQISFIVPNNSNNNASLPHQQSGQQRYKQRIPTTSVQPNHLPRNQVVQGTLIARARTSSRLPNNLSTKINHAELASRSQQPINPRAQIGQIADVTRRKKDLDERKTLYRRIMDTFGD